MAVHSLPPPMPDALAATESLAPLAGPAAAAVSPVRRALLARLRLRTWHWLLTPGWLRQPAAARLRGWARLLRWEKASPAERRRLVWQAAWLPAEAWREAGRAVARFGDEVQAEFRVSPTVQRRQIWWQAVRHGLHPQGYVDYYLYRPERRRQAAAYVLEPEHTRVLRWLHGAVPGADAFPVRDKSAFAIWCRARDLPAIPTLIAYAGGDVVASTLSENAPASLPRRDLFSKPAGASSGYGVTHWRYDDAGGWVGPDGRSWTAAALLAELARQSQALSARRRRASDRVLLQPCLENHPDVRALSSGALCTVRLVTYRTPGGQGQVAPAIYRMAAGGAPADNFSLGGIVAPIDMATGRLGIARRRRQHVIVPIDHHPDTGAAIAGVVLPYWAEALALVRRAFDAAFARPCIGWDVALTADGPVLVEGNSCPEPSTQATVDVAFGDTPLPAAFDAHLQRYLGA